MRKLVVMPFFRGEIPSEERLASPSLYQNAPADDPAAILEGVAMASLVGILRQLGELSEYAAEVFDNLRKEVDVTAKRREKLLVRVKKLERTVPKVEEMVLKQNDPLQFVHTPGLRFKADVKLNQDIFTHNLPPSFVLQARKRCQQPPQFYRLDRFREVAVGSCMKRYSDVTFFKTMWEQQESLKAQASLQLQSKRGNAAVRPSLTVTIPTNQSESGLSREKESLLKVESESSVKVESESSAKVEIASEKVQFPPSLSLAIPTDQSEKEQNICEKETYVPAYRVRNKSPTIQPTLSLGLPREESMMDNFVAREGLQSSARENLQFYPRKDLQSSLKLDVQFSPTKDLPLIEDLQIPVTKDLHFPAKEDANFSERKDLSFATREGLQFSVPKNLHSSTREDLQSSTLEDAQSTCESENGNASEEQEDILESEGNITEQKTTGPVLKRCLSAPVGKLEDLQDYTSVVAEVSDDDGLNSDSNSPMGSATGSTGFRSELMSPVLIDRQSPYHRFSPSPSRKILESPDLMVGWKGQRAFGGNWSQRKSSNDLLSGRNIEGGETEMEGDKQKGGSFRSVTDPLQRFPRVGSPGWPFGVEEYSRSSSLNSRRSIMLGVPPALSKWTMPEEEKREKEEIGEKGEKGEMEENGDKREKGEGFAVPLMPPPGMVSRNSQSLKKSMDDIAFRQKRSSEATIGVSSPPETTQFHSISSPDCDVGGGKYDRVHFLSATSSLQECESLEKTGQNVSSPVSSFTSTTRAFPQNLSVPSELVVSGLSETGLYEEFPVFGENEVNHGDGIGPSRQSAQVQLGFAMPQITELGSNFINLDEEGKDYRKRIDCNDGTMSDYFSTSDDALFQQKSTVSFLNMNSDELLPSPFSMKKPEVTSTQDKVSSIIRTRSLPSDDCQKKSEANGKIESQAGDVLKWNSKHKSPAAILIEGRSQSQTSSPAREIVSASPNRKGQDSPQLDSARFRSAFLAAFSPSGSVSNSVASTPRDDVMKNTKNGFGSSHGNGGPMSYSMSLSSLNTLSSLPDTPFSGQQTPRPTSSNSSTPTSYHGKNSTKSATSSTASPARLSRRSGLVPSLPLPPQQQLDSIDMKIQDRSIRRSQSQKTYRPSPMTGRNDRVKNERGRDIRGLDSPAGEKKLIRDFFDEAEKLLWLEMEADEREGFQSQQKNRKSFDKISSDSDEPFWSLSRISVKNESNGPLSKMENYEYSHNSNSHFLPTLSGLNGGNSPPEITSTRKMERFQKNQNDSQNGDELSTNTLSFNGNSDSKHKGNESTTLGVPRSTSWPPSVSSADMISRKNEGEEDIDILHVKPVPFQGFGHDCSGLTKCGHPNHRESRREEFREDSREDREISKESLTEASILSIDEEGNPDGAAVPLSNFENDSQVGVLFVSKVIKTELGEEMVLVSEAPKPRPLPHPLFQSRSQRGLPFAGGLLNDSSSPDKSRSRRVMPSDSPEKDVYLERIRSKALSRREVVQDDFSR